MLCQPRHLAAESQTCSQLPHAANRGLAQRPCLRNACADRKSGSVRVAPTSEFEATVGPPALRRSCGVAAVVGLLSYYDDQSLVVVMEATLRHAVCDRGPMPVHAIAKTAFLPLKPPPGTGTRLRSGPGLQPQPPIVRPPTAPEVRPLALGPRGAPSPRGCRKSALRRCAGARP